jgi:hypothetical protein
VYGSLDSVAALIRHRANSAGAFDGTTDPTATAVLGWLTERSAILDGMLAAAGYTPPATGAAAAALAAFASAGAAATGLMAGRESGYNVELEEKRAALLRAEWDRAAAFIASGALGPPQTARRGMTISSPQRADREGAAEYARPPEWHL